MFGFLKKKKEKKRYYVPESEVLNVLKLIDKKDEAKQKCIGAEEAKHNLWLYLHGIIPALAESVRNNGPYHRYVADYGATKIYVEDI